VLQRHPTQHDVGEACGDYAVALVAKLELSWDGSYVFVSALLAKGLAVRPFNPRNPQQHSGTGKPKDDWQEETHGC